MNIFCVEYFTGQRWVQEYYRDARVAGERAQQLIDLNSDRFSDVTMSTIFVS